MADDTYNLQRFVEAQNAVYDDVCAELRSGRKESHWMWFVFPQIAGLGMSHAAQHYAISSLAEAEAYLRHPILGPRLRECTGLTLSLEGDSAEKIFGFPDFLKFRSCLTLFSRATSDNKCFFSALEKYFGGEPDPLTLQRLALIALDRGLIFQTKQLRPLGLRRRNLLSVKRWKSREVKSPNGTTANLGSSPISCAVGGLWPSI